MPVQTFETEDGRTLSYSRRGNGPMLVCVPGGPGMDPEAYFAPMDLPGREVLVFAPRGTGQSSPPSSSEGYRLAGYVADLESLRTQLHVPRLTLYGNSYGGSVVLAYACAYPDRVERFVVSNAPTRVDATFKEAAAEARRRFATTMQDGAERLSTSDQADAALDNESSAINIQRAYRASMACCVAREGPVEAAYLDQLCSAPHNRQAVAGMWTEWRAGLDLLEGADAATARALVIAGEVDIAVPAVTVRLVVDALPNARYIEFADVGHFVAVEASERFRGIVLEFLGG